MKPVTGLPGCLVFKTSSGYLSCTPQQTLVTTPIVDPEVIVRAPALPASGATSIAISRWKDSAGQGSQAFAVGVSTTGHPIVYLSLDGTTNTLKTCAAVLPGGQPLKVNYNHTTGDVKFYTSSDGEVTWTLLDTQNLTGGGAPFNPARIVPFDVAGRNTSSALWWQGALTSVELHNGIGGAVAAICDLSHVWAGDSWQDPYGNVWHLRGQPGIDYEWNVTEAAVQGLVADLASIRAAIPAATTLQLIDKLTATASHSNSTDTTLWTAANLAASVLAAGRVLRVRLQGRVDNAVSGSIADTIRCRVNGSAPAAQVVCVAQTSGAGLTGAGWSASLDLYVETAGSSGKVSTLGDFNEVTVATSLGTQSSRTYADLARSVDLSGGLQVSVSGVAGAGGAGNTLYLDRASVVLIG